MKYILAIVAFFAVIAIFLGSIFLLPSHQKETSSVQKLSQESPTTIPSAVKVTRTTLFVPYWTLDGKTLPTDYDQLVYFGITADTNGIDTTEPGYKNISHFSKEAQQPTLLAIRLINPTVNEKILTDKVLQQKISDESISIAKEYGFSGIVLDLEYNALAFDSVTKRTTQLTQTFANTAHANNLSFYQTVYGDAFYRVRPYDMAAIGKASDGIFIMAYDFHKANGNPGPNFPLQSLIDEDYNFQQMVKDFSAKVPKNKITVLFGLFGYDWTINNKNQSLGQAEALTTNEAEQKFNTCVLKNCHIQQDNVSIEEKVTYTDKDERQHEVWFENMESVKKKEAVLTENGITQVGFWAYSYF